ncbi:MAG: transcription factor IIA subunit alpha [Geoglossum umbratile]|nr:MAG: transcription factor IIA subunit alpha [Geoglossum umbratile]
MSNNTVGGIYQRIIQDVIQNSAVDFEEAGVDGSTLEELKQVWQRKLSSLNVAQFPWDPPAPPQVPISNPATVPSNAPRHTSGAAVQPPAPSSVPALIQNGGSKIKTEPGYEPNLISGLQPSQASGDPSNVAAMRAAGLLSQKFHGQAASQVNALQGKAAGGLILPGQQRPVMQYPGQAHNQQAQQQRNQQTQQHRSVLGSAQTDGASDANEQWSAVMIRRNAQGQDEEMGTVEIDNLIRRGVEKMGVSIEGGGLMLPLSELHPGKKGKKRRRAAAQRNTTSEAYPRPTLLSTPTTTSASMPRIPHFDGAGDDSDGEHKMKPEAFDEDAINSDLDDDEDLDEDDGDDESMSQIMLCTYDKVQRVKNKWKCVLKDGVLTINGKE